MHHVTKLLIYNPRIKSFFREAYSTTRNLASKTVFVYNFSHIILMVELPKV